MKSLLQSWQELAVAATVLVALVLLYFAFEPPREITLADRPRPSTEHADFILQFLQATATNYRLEEGFVVLQCDSDTDKRLLQLLGGLSKYLDHLMVTNDAPDGKGPSLACVPNPQGGVDFVPLRQSSHPVEETERLIGSLKQQYDTVFAALKTLRPGAVGLSTGAFRGAGANSEASSITRSDSLRPPAELSPNIVTVSQREEKDDAIDLSEIRTAGGGAAGTHSGANARLVDR